MRMTLSKQQSAFLLLILALASMMLVQNFLKNATPKQVVQVKQKPQHSSNRSRTTHSSSSSNRSSRIYPIKVYKPIDSFDLSFTVPNDDDDDTLSPSKKKHLLCTRPQILQGQWVRQRNRDHPPYVPSTVHLRCYAPEYYKQSPYKGYHRWDTSDCKFTTFQPDLFCSILQGTSVLIVGDSLSWEHYRSLVQLLGQQTHQNYQHQSNIFHTNVGQSVCDNRVRIVYRRDDRLRNLTGALTETEFPSVVVLNRGAHYANDSSTLADISHNLKEIQQWLDQCRAYGIRCHFFWRTSVPGHPHCGNFTEPVNNITAIEEWIADRSNYNDHTMTYHWQDYQHQNLLVEELLNSQKEMVVRILDAYYLNVRRPDEHRAHQGDCLHNCYPGKMDVNSQLMLHYLRMDRTRDDVQRLLEVKVNMGWKTGWTTPFLKKEMEKLLHKPKHRV